MDSTLSTNGFNARNSEYECTECEAVFIIQDGKPGNGPVDFCPYCGAEIFTD